MIENGWTKAIKELAEQIKSLEKENTLLTKVEHRQAEQILKLEAIIAELKEIKRME